MEGWKVRTSLSDGARACSGTTAVQATNEHSSIRFGTPATDGKRDARRGWRWMREEEMVRLEQRASARLQHLHMYMCDVKLAEFIAVTGLHFRQN